MQRLLNQIIRFGTVGFLCFFLDYSVLLGLTELCGINYLLSSAFSFTFSTFVNYLLSMRFVFETNKGRNRFKEFIFYLILSAVGLCINQLVLWISVEKLNIIYQISKLGATAIVMVYNFISRKLMLER